MPMEGSRRLFEAIGTEDKTLRIYDDPETGGTGHCQHDIWATAIPFMLDWLAERS